MTCHSDDERYYMLQDLCLRSTKFLHDVFRRRWTAEAGTNWKDDEKHRKIFLDGPGRKLYKVVASPQKNILNSAKVEEWDLSLICLAIRRFISCINYEKENQAIEQLGTIGSHLATLQPETISKSEYDAIKKIIRRSLKSLGMKGANVKGWVMEVESVEASAGFKKMEVLFEQARDSEQQRLLEQASDYYSKAINIPNLLPVHVALAYEKRAGFCLSENGELDLAVMNIKEALNINNFSWSAHLLAANCYKIQNHISLALDHYERAFSIFPKMGKYDLDEYKKFVFKPTYADPQKPTLMPMTIEEYTKMIKEENNYMDTIIPKGVVPVNENFTGTDDYDPGFEYAVEGFKYYNGWDVNQDFVKAAELFLKSADCKNARGTAALAKCLLNGHGLARNHLLAISLYFDATTMCQTWPGLSTPIRGDHGVAEAQHALGRLCFDEDNLDYAAGWYELSMNNGHGFSATVYGNMVACWLAKEHDIKMAKMCWKEGVNLKAPTALKWLLRYYLNEIEPDLAKGYYRYGRAAKNPFILNWPEKPFNELITAIRKYRGTKENEVVRFEQDYKLTLKGLTFIDRLKRMEYYSDPNILRLESFLLTNPNFNGETESPGDGVPEKLTEEMIKEIERRAQTGDKSAIDFAIAARCASAIRAVVTTGKKDLTEDEKLKVLNLFYKIITIAYHSILVLDLPEGKMFVIFENLVKNEKNQKHGPVDEKLRICLTMVIWKEAPNKNNTVLLKVLKRGIRRYPDNILFYKFISIILEYNGDIEESRHWVEEGLKRDRKNADLLFQLARLIHHAPYAKYDMESEKYYRHFIAAAPKDHLMVPHAWYVIAKMHWQVFLVAKDNFHVKKRSANKIKECLGKAAEAESHQLPCFLPYKKEAIFDQIHFALEKHEKNDFKWRKQVVIALEKINKHYLKSPTRKLLIRFHRRDFRKTVMMNSEKKGMTSLPETSTPFKMKQPIAKNVSLWTPITLQEMNVVDSYCFENRKIELTLLDDSFNSTISINCVVEDNNGDVIRLHIYNVDLTEKTAQKFETGARLAVMNPCMIVENGQKHDWLRVDGLKCMKFLKTVKRMCGFCGEENASYSCPSCSRLYCGSECLQLDEERHDHELICLLRPNPKKKREKVTLHQ